MSKIRVSKIRVSEIRGSEIRGSKIRVSEIRGSKIRGSEIRVSKIRISSNHRELHGAIFSPGADLPVQDERRRIQVRKRPDWQESEGSSRQVKQKHRSSFEISFSTTAATVQGNNSGSSLQVERDSVKEQTCGFVDRSVGPAQPAQRHFQGTVLVNKTQQDTHSNESKCKSPASLWCRTGPRTSAPSTAARTCRAARRSGS